MKDSKGIRKTNFSIVVTQERSFLLYSSANKLLAACPNRTCRTRARLRTSAGNCGAQTQHMHWELIQRLRVLTANPPHILMAPLANQGSAPPSTPMKARMRWKPRLRLQLPRLQFWTVWPQKLQTFREMISTTHPPGTTPSTTRSSQTWERSSRKRTQCCLCHTRGGCTTAKGCTNQKMPALSSSATAVYNLLPGTSS